MLSERFWKYDYNTPYYHTINDKIENFNMNYFHKIAKLGIATTAELALNGLPTAIENESVTMFNQFQLFQNYPNPFNASTNISYFLPFNDSVILRIYDLNGKLVQTISPGHQTSGINHLLFDGSHLSSGIYFYQIRGTGRSMVNKMILLK
ncbi:MAG: T9SS type A sorting domain-containing protein [Candidatus Marinimicrobia bacterium]|nr:T9SS type A sorting domain-containing protein [Candidatus Neomarinimicrobiota bacterium]